MSDSPTVVVVEGNSDEPEPVVSEPVVVVAPADNSSDELAMAVGRLEAEVKGLRKELAEVSRMAEGAASTSEAALDIATEEPPIVEVEPEPEHHQEEHDEPPNNKHAFFKTFDELRAS